MKEITVAGSGARGNYTFREATADDFEFLYRLKSACLKEYVQAIWGWDESDQRRRFAETFDPSAIQVIIIDGGEIGMLSLEDRGGELYITGLYIAPSSQNQGVGTAILGEILAGARKKGQPVSLQVLKGNPARRLYERLGFAVYDQSSTHYRMRTT